MWFYFLYKTRERVSYEKNIIIKALVLGSIGCAFTITGMAANGHGQGYADSTTEVNGASMKQFVQIWMDRTDITVGLNLRWELKFPVETLQPLTHYDENSKSVFFVQGGIGKGGQEDKASYFSGGGNGGFWYPYNPITKKVNNGIDLRNIMILSHWGLLPMLG